MLGKGRDLGDSGGKWVPAWPSSPLVPPVLSLKSFSRVAWDVTSCVTLGKSLPSGPSSSERMLPKATACPAALRCSGVGVPGEAQRVGHTAQEGARLPGGATGLGLEEEWVVLGPTRNKNG